MSENDWKYSPGWFLEAPTAEIRELLRNSRFNTRNYDDSKRELDRRSASRRSIVDRIVFWLTFVFSAVAAVASVMALTDKI